LFTTALSGDIPAVKHVKAGKTLTGDNWMGHIAHEDYAVTASKRSPLAPGWLFFVLALLAMGGAWLREGK